MIYFVAIVAGLAGILFGFDEGVIASALGFLREAFDIAPGAEGFMTAAVPLGALFGAVVAGRAAERYGRRTSLLAAALMFVAGAVISSQITSVWMLSVARLILGFAVGVAALVAPLYIAESAPARRRGMLVSIYQLSVTLGILGAYVANYALGEDWRTMFLLGAVPGVALFAGMLCLSDTRRWLAGAGPRRPVRRWPGCAACRATIPRSNANSNGSWPPKRCPTEGGAPDGATCSIKTSGLRS